MLISSDPMAVDDLANRIDYFVSTGMKDDAPVASSCWNCRLSSLLDVSQARRIGGGVN